MNRLTGAAAACLVSSTGALAQFTVYQGDQSVQVAWLTALGNEVALEDFERFRGVPSPSSGDSDFVTELPDLGLVFETDVPDTFLGVYSDARFAHSGVNQLANFGGRMAQFSSFRILPAPGRAIRAFAFWQCDPQGDQPMQAYDGAGNLVGTIVGHINDGTGQGFAGFISDVLIARIEVPGGLGDGFNHIDDLWAVTEETYCPADYNRDGGIDGADVEAFFNDWELGLESADVNRDGGIDGADVEAFFIAWENGGC